MASKRKKRRQSCERKVRYDTFEKANGILYSHFIKNGKMTGRLNVYKCPFCGGYHLGRENKRRLNARRRNEN